MCACVCVCVCVCLITLSPASSLQTMSDAHHPSGSRSSPLLQPIPSPPSPITPEGGLHPATEASGGPFNDTATLLLLAGAVLGGALIGAKIAQMRHS